MGEAEKFLGCHRIFGYTDIDSHFTATQATHNDRPKNFIPRGDDRHGNFSLRESKCKNAKQ
jgi:hypothetical protein